MIAALNLSATAACGAHADQTEAEQRHAAGRGHCDRGFGVVISDLKVAADLGEGVTGKRAADRRAKRRAAARRGKYRAA